MNFIKRMTRGTSAQSPEIISSLDQVSIPFSQESCRRCSDPCEEGWHEEFPKMKLDTDTELLDTVKPYRRQIVVSTGKTDWDNEVTETKGSLAAYVADTVGANPAPKPSKSKSSIPGLFESTASTRISILNGSHTTVSDDSDAETVLVFPDYTAVTEVPRSLEGAEALFKSALNPPLPRGGASEDHDLKRWVLQYSCVILLCSHKKRDKRCHIVAPKLEHAFTHALTAAEYEVHTNLDSSALVPLKAPTTTTSSTDEDSGNSELLDQLKAASASKQVLILKNSHIGGHKFAGNVIIYTPTGTSVWYGRVSTHEVEAIVQETIVGGKVLPPLLRATVDASRAPGCTSLNNW